MTSTSLHDQADLNATLAELPPLPMAALMIGVYNLLQEGAGPQLADQESLMYDSDAFETVASDIALWEGAALLLPLAQVRAILADSQHELAESLNAFNGIYLNHADGNESADAFTQAIGEVTRRATAMAIFTLGLSQRLHQAARQN